MTISQIGHGPSIDAPTPERRTGGLLDVAEIRNGVSWIDPNDMFLSWNCLDTSATVVCGPDPTPTKTFSSPVVVDGAAFVAYLGLQCKPLGNLQNEADRVFDLAESRAVERGFETAVLSGGTSVGTAGTAADALGKIEQALAAGYVGTGIIHTSPAAATKLFANLLLVNNGGKFFTQLGTPVVVGAGYSATAMYGTGSVVLYRSERVSVSGPDMANNVMSALAERAYVAFTDCIRVKVTGITGLEGDGA